LSNVRQENKKGEYSIGISAEKLEMFSTSVIDAQLYFEFDIVEYIKEIKIKSEKISATKAKIRMARNKDKISELERELLVLQIWFSEQIGEEVNNKFEKYLKAPSP